MASRAVKNLRTYIGSVYYMLTVFLLACVLTVLRAEVAGVFVFAAVILLTLMISGDVLTSALPFFLLNAMLFKCHDSYDVFVRYWWLAVPFVSGLVFHFIRSRKKLVAGPSLWGIALVSAAVTLGGVGVITAPEYFSGVSVYHTLGLGFGMLAVYIILSTHMSEHDGQPFSERLPLMMVFLGAFACFMIFAHYIENFSMFLRIRGILDFQWRNNVSTLLIMALPFPFYLSRKRFGFMGLGLVFYFALLISGSRGGLIFGTVEFLLCLLAVLVYDKKHRRLNLLLSAALLVAAAVSIGNSFVLFDKTVRRIFSFKENEIRLGLLTRAIGDFQSNPVFGRGLAYFGNRDIHESAKFALCWYHSSPFQIIGSFGIVGAVCFLFQLVVRLAVFATRKSFFTATLFLSWAGVEMMSLVNPGIFCPLPYLFMVTMLFVAMEKQPDARS
ncbi:MAG: O-antigen ligase family protein [Oscillospiraceae bacterium]|nr:O-antigen ligase family protein [Oscillospiraceae bacterium]